MVEIYDERNSRNLIIGAIIAIGTFLFTRYLLQVRNIVLLQRTFANAELKSAGSCRPSYGSTLHNLDALCLGSFWFLS